MKASEGKLGRVFMLLLEKGDKPVESIEKFAADNGVLSAQVFVMADRTMGGTIAPDPDGTPRLRLSVGQDAADAEQWIEGEVMVQEMLGIHFRRVVDPASGHETLARVSGKKTRVMERAAPSPDVSGPGTVPVYLFNVEFN